MSSFRPEVTAALERARGFGYLGPGPIDAHVQHALGFAVVAESVFDAAVDSISVVDLGSGGGVPGLVLMDRWPSSRWLYLDTNQRRMDTLREAVTELGASSRASVVCGRAEECVRDPQHRSSFDLVVARGFGPPAVTAECAAPLLRVGGVLVVSEPPDDRQRWDTDALAELGLEGCRESNEYGAFFVARQLAKCPERFPRRVGIPNKRPLF